MTLEWWFAYLLTSIILSLSPGSGAINTMTTSLNHGYRGAVASIAGLQTGLAIHIVLVWAGIALLGLHLIIEKMAWLHTLIMVGGGLYLCWMGYQMLRGALKKEAVSAPAPQVELAKSGRSFLKGLLTNLANPKAIIYFGSASPLLWSILL